MKLGVIGYGLRIRSIISEIIKQEPSCKVTAIVDIRKDAISAELQAEGQHAIHFYDTAEEMLRIEELDGILIGTRCSLHTPMAIKVLQSGLPLYLEKPVATNMDDLIRLKSAFEASASKVVVSFPLRLTTIVLLAKEIIDSGKIGTVEHVQAVNNVPYGSVYFQSWYRDERETGGLFLQKATHDFDYINSLLGSKPAQICAMTSKQIFKGSRPAGLTCGNCEDNRICLDSSFFKTPDKQSWDSCCYAEDTGNEDSGSSLIRYESGMHVSYSQNFFARREAGARGARLLGYKGTLDFDFYTGKVNVYMHHTPRVETYDISGGEGHFGGDTALAQNFIDIMQKGADSLSTLDDGLLSALMCLKAKESAETGMFRSLDWT
ncbi:Gfo/Idh/MocA family protein [Paenibacillus nasutitermitis]|uniref:Gfo/Idh/MocA family oxidoreductase n=1 Tax=Paenibacillus nasutitermitis TaxID=1652958 RepID=A0A916YN42_9BACL|nr:Gfo/Idh/MocA family oxidoreductase [Paenibacillus nasutitermitis]GGD53743.1 hypothetical protein GCM10010911_09090 [Paenibacillus nasutitermitis]